MALSYNHLLPACPDHDTTCRPKHRARISELGAKQFSNLK